MIKYWKTILNKIKSLLLYFVKLYKNNIIILIKFFNDRLKTYYYKYI